MHLLTPRNFAVTRDKSKDGKLEISQWKEPGSDVFTVRGRTVLQGVGNADEVAALQSPGNSSQVSP